MLLILLFFNTLISTLELWKFVSNELVSMAEALKLKPLSSRKLTANSELKNGKTANELTFAVLYAPTGNEVVYPK